MSSGLDTDAKCVELGAGLTGRGDDVPSVRRILSREFEADAAVRASDQDCRHDITPALARASRHRGSRMHADGQCVPALELGVRSSRRARRAVEPSAPVRRVEQRDLAVVVRRDVVSGRNRQQGERLTDFGIAPHQPGNGEFARRLEAPAVLALLLRIARRGEFVKCVGEHEAAVAREFAAVRAHIEHRLAPRRRPRPAPLDQLRNAAVAVELHDRRALGDPHVARLEVGDAFRKFERDLVLGEEPADGVDVLIERVEVAHGWRAVSRTGSRPSFRRRSGGPLRASKGAMVSRRILQSLGSGSPVQIGIGDDQLAQF